MIRHLLRLGRAVGRENARIYLKANPEVLESIRVRIKSPELSGRLSYDGQEGDPDEDGVINQAAVANEE